MPGDPLPHGVGRHEQHAVDAGEGGGQRRRVIEVGGPHRRAPGREVGELGRVAGEQGHVVATVNQQLGQPLAYHARAASNEDFHGNEVISCLQLALII